MGEDLRARDQLVIAFLQRFLVALDHRPSTIESPPVDAFRQRRFGERKLVAIDFLHGQRSFALACGAARQRRLNTHAHGHGIWGAVAAISTCGLA